jgi:nucleotide-binding universal stress UspA family protein
MMSMADFRIILCPVDFSPSAEKALRYAEGLAKQFGSEIVLVHAYEDPAYIMPMTGYLGPEAGLINQLRAHLEEQMERWKIAVANAGFVVRTDLLEGVAHQVVIDAAKEHKADLIVMSTHGRTGLSHALMGSVAERVIRLAHCPVLTVRSAPATDH